ncbi:MAG: hypothetical protein WCF49_04065 [Xanthobacteraceae bacterium]
MEIADRLIRHHRIYWVGLERMSADRPKADPGKRLKMRGQTGKCLAANVIGRRPHA